MRMRSLRRLATVALCLAAHTDARQATAQASPVDTTPPLIEAIPRAQRPSLMVMAFEFAAPLTDEDREELNSLGAIAAAMRGQGGPTQGQQSGVNLGKATADLLMERLLQSQNFRVLERRALEQLIAEQNLASSDRAAAGQDVATKAKLLGARYMLTGSITKFGKSVKKKGGILGAVTKVALGVAVESKQTAYEVGLTARIVETATGEVVASISTDGVVNGDRSRLIGGMAVGGGGGAGGLGGSQVTGEREKRIAESLALAVDKLTLKLVEARKSGDMVADPAR
jgi:curli biogenesis system outer membrane secretion channel CsgG